VVQVGALLLEAAQLVAHVDVVQRRLAAHLGALVAPAGAAASAAAAPARRRGRAFTRRGRAASAAAGVVEALLLRHPGAVATAL
jgi:hypothetical protein